MAAAVDTPAAGGLRHQDEGYASSQPLPSMEDTYTRPPYTTREEEYFLTRRGSDTLPMGAEEPSGTVGLHRWIRHNRPPRIGVAVVYIPSSTTIHIDVAGI